MPKLIVLCAGAVLCCAALAFAAPKSAPAAEDHASSPTETSAIAALRVWLGAPAADRPALESQPFATVALTRQEADAASRLLWQDVSARLAQARKAEWDARAITLDGKTMKFEFKVFGDRPQTGRRLFISMHGGGHTAPEVNEQQWRNQVRLYEPAEGVYLAPRAPTDAWNMWHQDHIDPLFDRIIQDAVLFEGVDPDRVYLMGYSAGGDGVYQLAPRFADRLAAAAMMAGHPNDAQPDNLRNLPFAIHMGERDGAFNRNEVAKQWGAKLDALAAADPGPAPAYEHFVKLHAGKSHWMDRQDAEAVPWMSVFARNPDPARIVWRKGRVPQPRFYWLGLPGSEPGTLVEAHREATDGVQTVVIDRLNAAKPGNGAAPSDVEVRILLRDGEFDLDKPVRVVARSQTLAEGKAPRTIATLWGCLSERADPRAVFSGELRVRVAAWE